MLAKTIHSHTHVLGADAGEEVDAGALRDQAEQPSPDIVVHDLQQHRPGLLQAPRR